MPNTYTGKLKLRQPAEGDGNWADEMNSNAQIMEVVQAAILEDNYVVSGLVTSTAAGLVADYTAGVVVINGTQFSVASGSKTAADNTDGTAAPNFLYVDSSGVMQISVTPPTGEYAPIAVVDTLSAAITRIGDLRHQKTPKAPLSGGTFTGLVNLAAGADIASDTTVDLTAATGNFPRITGTTPTSAVTMNTGQPMTVIADAAWPLIYHATTNKLSTGEDYTCAPGDKITYIKDNSGVVHGIIHDSAAWTNYGEASTIVGWSAFTVKDIHYKRRGKILEVNYRIQGTSNASAATFTLPFTLDALTYSSGAYVVDNGVAQAYPGWMVSLASSATITVYKDMASAAFTASGTKAIRGQFFAHIA